VKEKLKISSLSGMVTLNVGGREFKTSVETLTKFQGTFFTSLFSAQWELERDHNGQIFIDRDGDLFGYILNYLRSGEFLLPDERARQQFILEAQFFGLRELLGILSVEHFNKQQLEDSIKVQNLFPYSTILDDNQKLQLNEFYGVKDNKWNLLYKGSRDGFKANDFHRLCDNKGPTLSIINTTDGHMFGGFTSMSWTSDDEGAYKADATAFLFTLSNPHGIKPTKYVIKEGGKCAIRSKTIRGPMFGGGHDIFVGSLSNSNAYSYIKFPYSFIDTTGKGDKTFTGSNNFTSSEIEVYSLWGSTLYPNIN